MWHPERVDNLKLSTIEEGSWGTEEKIILRLIQVLETKGVSEVDGVKLQDIKQNCIEYIDNL